MLFVCSVAWLFLLGCQYQCKRLTGKTRLRNDLLCVDGDVKLKPTHSFTHFGGIVGVGKSLGRNRWGLGRTSVPMQLSAMWIAIFSVALLLSYDDF